MCYKCVFSPIVKANMRSLCTFLSILIKIEKSFVIQERIIYCVEKAPAGIIFHIPKTKERNKHHWCSGGVAYRRGVCHYTFVAMYYYTLHSCIEPPKALFCTTDSRSNMGSNTQGVKNLVTSKKKN